MRGGGDRRLADRYREPPRRQRHTTRRMWRWLVAVYGAQLIEVMVLRYWAADASSWVRVLVPARCCRVSIDHRTGVTGNSEQVVAVDFGPCLTPEIGTATVLGVDVACAAGRSIAWR